MPVKTPVAGFIVPTVVLLLLHVPPGVASVNVSDVPRHGVRLPLIIPGIGLTVNGAVL